MSTATRTAANRRNSRKSTGPRTAPGKAIVARNAVRHGLLSAQVLLPQEDGAALAAFAEGLHAELRPVGTLEGFLLDTMITAAWRLRRLVSVEDHLFLMHHYEAKPTIGTAFTGDHQDHFTRLARYQATIERSFYKAMSELARLQEARRPPPGQVSLAGTILQRLEEAWGKFDDAPKQIAAPDSAAD